MTEERAELSCMQSKICKWSHYIVGVVFAGILFVGLIELITLSKDVEESRRMMKEFSSNLSKIKQENEELRKHLREAEKTLKVITGEQLFNVKDSHVRRARKERVEVERTEHKCHKVNTCLDKYPREQLFNCTTVRRCMPPPARIHVHSLPGGTINSIITSWSTGGAGMSKNLTWLSHDPKLTYAIEFSADDYIKIIRGGIYFVYCNLRVASKYIEEVSIKMYHNGHEEILLSTSLNQNVSPVHDVKLYRQASIGSGAKLYVQVKRSSFDFKGIKYSATLRSSVLYGLFPYAFSLEKTQGNDNLGLFMIDKCDLS